MPLGMLPSRRSRFSRMSAKGFKSLAVVHKAKVNVCESGVEAAAGTSNEMFTENNPSQEKPTPLQIKVDRPFAFQIMDNATGTILFLGIVNQL